MIVDLNFICIYLLINNFTGQLYVGQTNNFLKRINEHFLGKGVDNNSYIDKAILKYGREAFSFKPLEVFDEYDKDLLNEREMYWIEKYNTYNGQNHYNLTIGGDGLGAGEEHPCYRHDIDTNVLVTEYFDNGLSEGEIAKKYNIPRATVQSRLDNTGRSKRDSAEVNNTTGYYRVSKQKTSYCKQGFLYQYQYPSENGKKKAIRSVDIKKLELKVKAKGLPWRKFNRCGD